MSLSSQDDLVVLGRITAAHGIKGWVKILSHTDPKAGIFDYSPWLIKPQVRGDWQAVKVLDGRPQGKGLIAQLEGCTDRNRAETYQGHEIAVLQSQFDALPKDEYYWHELEGLRVICGEAGPLLGKVDHLIETGANDVLIVKPCEGSLDGRERLLPYLWDRVIKQVDLAAGEIRVDWDPDY